jgi:hypothetical protein
VRGLAAARALLADMEAAWEADASKNERRLISQFKDRVKASSRMRSSLRWKARSAGNSSDEAGDDDA